MGLFGKFHKLKCESKFLTAGEDSVEAEFTPAQKSTEARALVTRRRAERRSSSTCQRRGEKLIRERPFTVGLARLGCVPGQPGAASGWLVGLKTAPRGPAVKGTVD